MRIHGPSQVHPAQSVNAPHATRLTKPTEAASTAAGDQLEISAAGQLADRIGQLPDIRADRVAELRAQIAAGTYETADKLDVAVTRLLDEIG